MGVCVHEGPFACTHYYASTTMHCHASTIMQALPCKHPQFANQPVPPRVLPREMLVSYSPQEATRFWSTLHGPNGRRR